MTRFAGINTSGMFLEAEVAPTGLNKFEARYQAATGASISPGTTPHYQEQTNKWGAELRVYFNDAAVAATLGSAGLHVETRSTGYLSGDYTFRVNDNNLWWELVESHGLSLGTN